MAWLLIFLVVSVLLPVHATLADDALVLPRGRWRVSADARFSLPITKRFTPGGGTEDLAADFNREINSTTFPDLRLVEAAFRLPAGSARLAAAWWTLNGIFRSTRSRRPMGSRIGSPSGCVFPTGLRISG